MKAVEIMGMTISLSEDSSLVLSLNLLTLNFSRSILF